MFNFVGNGLTFYVIFKYSLRNFVTFALPIVLPILIIMIANYKFHLGRKKNKPNTLELEVYKGRDCRVFLTTGFEIEPKHWDNTRQQCNARCPNYILINGTLKKLIERIQVAELQAENNDNIFGVEEIKRAAKGVDVMQVSMIELFNKYIDENSAAQKIKYASWVKYRSYIRRLERFLKEKRKLNMTIDKFNINILNDFNIWLISQYKLSTVYKYHTSIRQFFKRAKRENIIKVNPYESFTNVKPRNEKKQALTLDNIKALETIDRETLRAIDSRMELVLDKLLLSIYTGLRISDNNALRKSDIKETPDGLVLDIVTIKGKGQRIVLPLAKLFNGKPEAIVRRYLSMNKDCETLFPYIPDCKVNERLKPLALMAGIKFNLTFHIARHTCATLLAEMVGNPFVIMQILGHEDIKTSMIYVHNSYSTMVQNLSNVIWK